MRAHKGLAAVALAFIATTALSHAASVLQVRAGTGTPATVTGGNDYPFLAEPLMITLDGVLETTGAGKLTFEYLGYEAAWINSFLVEGEDCFTTGRSEVGATCSVATSGGIVDFQAGCRKRPGSARTSSPRSSIRPASLASSCPMCARPARLPAGTSSHPVSLPRHARRPAGHVLSLPYGMVS